MTSEHSQQNVHTCKSIFVGMFLWINLLDSFFPKSFKRLCFKPMCSGFFLPLKFTTVCIKHLPHSWCADIGKTNHSNMFTIPKTYLFVKQICMSGVFYSIDELSFFFSYFDRFQILLYENIYIYIKLNNSRSLLCKSIAPYSTAQYSMYQVF